MKADAIWPLPLPGVDDPADDELVRAALAGDAQGWARLIERHNHRVVVSLLGRGLTIDRAREIAQETWLRLIERHRAGRLESLVLPGLAVVQAGFPAAAGVRVRLRSPRADLSRSGRPPGAVRPAGQADRLRGAPAPA